MFHVGAWREGCACVCACACSRHTCLKQSSVQRADMFHRGDKHGGVSPDETWPITFIWIVSAPSGPETI